MKIKVKEGHAGVMTLHDGTQMNYGVISITQKHEQDDFLHWGMINTIPDYDYQSSITNDFRGQSIS